MARIFITGSADGLGQMAAKLLVEDGHDVVLHARNKQRAADAMAAVPEAETVVVGDLASIAETKRVAEHVNQLGHFDAVIHNAGIGYQEPGRVTTADGLSQLFAVNSLAPYILTCLIEQPERLIYTSSGLHQSGSADMTDLNWDRRRWNGTSAYSDTKLHNLILAFAVARKWPDMYANGLEPGWVATKMGGAGAPDSLADAPKTQVWLATSNDKDAMVTGKYFYHQQLKDYNKAAADVAVQEAFMAQCAKLSGVAFPD